MLSKTEKEKIRLMVIKELPETHDLFDTDAEIDSTLRFSEAKDNILEKIDIFREKEVNTEVIKEMEMAEKVKNIKKESNNFWKKINIKVLVCLGDTRTGKTALMFKVLQNFNKPIYIYQHPKPHLIKALGYNNLNSLSELSRITDSVVYIDEPQRYWSRYDKSINEKFLLLCSLAAQNDINLIFSTSNTRWINRGLESYVSHWVLKDLDMTLIKQGSVAKRIIRKLMPLAVEDLNLNVNEYIFYSKKDSYYNGMHDFKKPIYFTDEFSKAYKNIPFTDVCQKSASESASDKK